MKIRSIVFLMLVALFALTTAAYGQAKQGQPVVRIGMVADGPWARDQDIIDIFKAEIRQLAAGEFEVRFPREHTLSGNWTVSGIDRAIERLLSSSEVDLILTLGVVSSHKICQHKGLTKPVIAPFVVDAELQGLPLKEGASGVNNLSYLNPFSGIARSVQTFRRIVAFTRLALMADRFVFEEIPPLQKVVRQMADAHGLEIQVVGIEASVGEALDHLPPGIQAVLVTSLPRVSKDEFRKLADGLIQKRLPSFSYWERSEVELGLFASIAPKSSLQEIARSTAINIQDIVRGENAGSLPVAVSLGEKLTINMATARAIDVSPSWKVLTEADLLNEEAVIGERVLSLDAVVQEALSANLDLAVADRNVSAGEQRVAEARSQLWPQIGIGSQASLIDEDRAEASFGLQPERLWTGTAAASQLIYSDKTWSNYTVEKHFQTGRQEQREAVRLDIVQAAATAYLNVLRTRAIERIQKENLKLTRENLERARIRVSIGAAGPEEVYRWESEIANRRQIVLASESVRLDAMSALNRILNRPLSETFSTREGARLDPTTIVKDKRFFTYLANPRNISLLRDFLVQEGLGRAPELRGLAAAIAARKRILTSAKRGFWVPDVELKGNVTETFAKEGAGSEPGSIGSIAVPDKDDTDWSAGVFLTFPLFTGGGKIATFKRTREELAQLRLEQDAAADRIEEKVINAVNLLRASYPSISFSKDAADAAQKNLKLVTDSYTRGIKSIIDLIDAQNRALVDDQHAANAVYDFMIDLMGVQRSVGRFIFFAGEDEQQAWAEKLADYFISKGVSLNRP